MEQPGIRLILCEPCRVLALKWPGEQRDGWNVLPALCAECSAKVAQCVRLLATGGKIVPTHKRYDESR